MYRCVLPLPRLWHHRGRLKALTIDQSRCGRSGGECTDGLPTPSSMTKSDEVWTYQAINWDRCISNKMNSAKICQDIPGSKTVMPRWEKDSTTKETTTYEHCTKWKTCIYLTEPLDSWKPHPANEHSSEETCGMEQVTLIPSTSPACRTWSRMRQIQIRASRLHKVNGILCRWSLRASRYRKYGAMAPAQIAEFAAAHAAAQHT